MKRYPSSFLQMVTVGYILVAIPFLLVTGYACVTLETLDRHYRAAINDFSETSRLTNEIVDDLIEMERALRLYEILKNADSLSDYEHARSDWRGNVESLSRLPTMPERVVKELRALTDSENLAYAATRNTQSKVALRSAVDAVKLRLRSVEDDVHAVLAQDLAQFKSDADALRQKLLLAMGIAVLASLCFLWAGRRLLSRLIGHFERAIVRLGKGDLQRAIKLHGPNDMRWLGRWLEWLRRRLVALERERTQVLRHVSHELKTPLAALREGASLLAEQVPGSLTAEQARIVLILQSNSQRLQTLIEGLLRLQQAGHAAGRIGLEVLRFDQLIEQVLETHRLIAAERGIEFQAELREVEIIAGREGLLTIVHNLLSNAVKFSPEQGRIRIDLAPNGQQVVLSVRDHGPGIAAQDRAHIFEPFYRSSASRLIAGVGLGLAITREIVLAHQGELILLESPQGGAHFRVVLPLNAAA